MTIFRLNIRNKYSKKKAEMRVQYLMITWLYLNVQIRDYHRAGQATDVPGQDFLDLVPVNLDPDGGWV
jgi:hypothetical protein